MWIPLAPQTAGLPRSFSWISVDGTWACKIWALTPAAGTDHLSYTELARALPAPQWASLHYRKSISKLERFQERPLIWQAPEYLPCEERQEELGSASLQQKWVWVNLTVDPSTCMELTEETVRLFTDMQGSREITGTSWNKRGSDCIQRFFFFLIRTVRQWHRWHTEVVQSQPLEIFKCCLKETLNNLVWSPRLCCCKEEIGLQAPWDPFQQELPCDPKNFHSVKPFIIYSVSSSHVHDLWI